MTKHAPATPLPRETRREWCGTNLFVFFNVDGAECFVRTCNGRIEEIRRNDASDKAIRRTSKLGRALLAELGE